MAETLLRTACRCHRCNGLLVGGCDEQKGGLSLAILEENIMGRYILAWLLGVPLTLLVIIYLIFN
jgi:hypothetical protein